MPIRTQESLQKLFQECRNRQEKKQLKAQKEQEEKLNKLNKKKEMEAYRRAQESIKKALADKLIKEQKIEQQRAFKQLKTERTISIYHTRYVERFMADDDLYTSREELEEAEPNVINWSLWDRLVDATKKSLKKYSK